MLLGNLAHGTGELLYTLGHENNLRKIQSKHLSHLISGYMKFSLSLCFYCFY